MPNALERMVISLLMHYVGSVVSTTIFCFTQVRNSIHMHDEKYAKERFGAANKAHLVLPSLGPEKKRIVYTIYEYDPLLDSSNMTMDDWVSIAKDVKVHFHVYSLELTDVVIFVSLIADLL